MLQGVVKRKRKKKVGVGIRRENGKGNRKNRTTTTKRASVWVYEAVNKYGFIGFHTRFVADGQRKGGGLW